MLENFGFKQDICSERIKKLREKYKITMKTVAKYCSQQNEANFSQSTLSLWENGKRIPTIDNFSRVADLFAVDLNWLIGRSDGIYSEGVIKNLELASFPVNITTENITVELMVDIPEDYLDYEKRRTTYSLEARANIVFLFTILKYEWEEYINDRIYELDNLTAEEIRLKALKMSKYFYMKINKNKLLKNYNGVLREIFQTKTAKFTE